MSIFKDIFVILFT